MQINNGIFFRRRSKIAIAEHVVGAASLNYLATVVKNVQSLGYTFSPALIEACRTLSLNDLCALYEDLLEHLRRAVGAHRTFIPMYPGFPAQVMALSDAELYLNAIVHYITDGKWVPAVANVTHSEMNEVTKTKIIGLGSNEEFESIFGAVASSNTSLSEQDKEDIVWFISSYGADIKRLLPETLPQKENMACVASLLIQHGQSATDFIAKNVKTATDVLRLAAAMSGGDISLADATKFKTFSRPQRHLLLGLLEQCQNATEDMLRWKGRWIRLGEKLHPTEYRNRYPATAAAFDILRNDLPFNTFNGRLEEALATCDTTAAIQMLSSRPGDFARRLDHLLRTGSDDNQIIASFAAGVSKISTPVLLQLRKHFEVRNAAGPIRVFFPKGNLASAHAEDNDLPPINARVCQDIVYLCTDTLIDRFKSLPSLGKTFVDPQLADYPIPFAARSSSRSFRTLTRGSKLPLPANCNVLRFFIWWKNGNGGRTDIDLSASTFDEDFTFKDVVSYYNLKTFGGVHSGDIVDAPNGASEFIDINLTTTKEQDVRYVVMSVTSYSRDPFSDLPECFAGWMSREEPGSGEVYEPRTVVDRVDLTANTLIAIPLVFDLVERKAIWCDLSLRHKPRYNVHVHGNLSSIALTLRTMENLNKPSLYDLFLLHAAARGELVETAETAETLFSVENETPFRREEIASQFMS